MASVMSGLLLVGQLGKDELGEYLGALSPASMRGVNQAVTIALALT